MSQHLAIIAARGLVQDQGLDNSFVNTLFTEYANTNIISKAQQAISDADGVGVDISDLGNDIMPGLVGNVPSAYTTVTPTSSLRSAYYTYATTLFASGDHTGFLQFLIQSNGYATSVFNTMDNISTLNYTNLEDHGAKVNVQSDTVTAGLTGFLIVNTQDNLNNFGEDIIGLGNIFDYKDLELFGTARGLAKLVIDNELGLAQPLEDFISSLDLSTDIDWYNTSYEDFFYSLLDNININDEFRKGFEFANNPRVRTLADVLNPKKSLLTSYDNINFSSYTEVAQALTKFNRIRIRSNIELGDLIKSLVTPGALSNLDNITLTLPTDTTDTILAQVGTGDGVYGQATVRDILGPVSGTYLQNRLDEIVTALAVVSASSDGVNIIAGYDNIISVAADAGGAPYVVTGVGAGSYASKALAIAAIETALDTYYNNLRSFLSIGSLELRQASETIYNNWDAIGKQVFDSKALLTKVDIDTTNFSSSKAIALSFAEQLPSIGRDQHNLGARQILLDLIETNTIGEAIKGSLLAGQNQKILKDKGLTVNI